MTNRPWATVILAAGLASRMGRLKPLLPLGETTVLERVIRLHQEAGATHVIVVLGWQAERLRPLVERHRAQPIINARFREGMFTSVAAGLRALPPAATGLFVHPADIPLVRPFTLRRLVAAGRRRPESVIHPCFCGQRGHPPLIPGHLAGTIAADSGEGGLKAVLGRIGADICDLEVADEHILFDMDEPEDHAVLQSRWQHYDLPTDLECQVLLTRVYPAPAGMHDHAQAVAGLAVALAEALNQAGRGLDVGLVQAAALLHDLAKGRRGHDRVGARWLARMGYGRVAGVVAAHIDLTLGSGEPIGEAQVVFLADKMMQGDQRVSLPERFEAGLKRYGRDPAARAAVQQRLENALAMQQRVEAALGRPIGDIIP
jgi:CTP:molybdopterin cytidylyltransferase MocA